MNCDKKEVSIKYKSAIGLKYNSESCSTPTVNIRGDFLNADQIVELAKKNGIPVVENPSLVKFLKLMELDEEIPEDLFEAVAILLNNLESL